jgi:hypothetical protein
MNKKAPSRLPRRSNLSIIQPITNVNIIPIISETISLSAEYLALFVGSTKAFAHLKHRDKIRYFAKYAISTLITTSTVFILLPTGRKGITYKNIKKKMLIVSNIITIFFVLILDFTSGIDNS